MNTYVDTSVLVKSYVFEPRSEEAIGLLDDLTNPIPLSPLLRLEFTNALNLKRFRNEITAPELESFLQAFDADITSGVYRPAPQDLLSIYATALELSGRWSGECGARSLDILHVATAIELEAERFLTFDHRQGILARNVGLQVTC